MVCVCEGMCLCGMCACVYVSMCVFMSVCVCVVCEWGMSVSVWYACVC